MNIYIYTGKEDQITITLSANNEDEANEILKTLLHFPNDFRLYEIIED
jgi:hypothetical protein